jgi:hypothetical protein
VRICRVYIYIYIYNIYVCVQSSKKKTGRFRKCRRLGRGEHAASHMYIYCNPLRKYPLAPFHPRIVKSLSPPFADVYIKHIPPLLFYTYRYASHILYVLHRRALIIIIIIIYTRVCLARPFFQSDD